MRTQNYFCVILKKNSLYLSWGNVGQTEGHSRRECVHNFQKVSRSRRQRIAEEGKGRARTSEMAKLKGENKYFRLWKLLASSKGGFCTCFLSPSSSRLRVWVVEKILLNEDYNRHYRRLLLVGSHLPQWGVTGNAFAHSNLSFAALLCQDLCIYLALVL